MDKTTLELYFGKRIIIQWEHEIKKQYDLNIIPSTFMDKFGEYLV